MMLKKRFFKKIALSILIVMIFAFIIPLNSHAAILTGIVTKPLCLMVNVITDGINHLFAGITHAAIDWDTFEEGIDAYYEGNVEEAWNKAVATYQSTFMSPDKIFQGKVPVLDANIFDAGGTDTFEAVFDGSGASIAPALKNEISNVYVLLRNISAVMLLCLLIYTGIRILLTTGSPRDEAKWKEALMTWVKALCLLMFMHFIMIGVFFISKKITEALGYSTMGDLSIVGVIRGKLRRDFWLYQDTAYIVDTIMYVYVTYLTIVFFFAYFKRLVWIVILIIFSPIVAVMYAFGKRGHEVFNKWLKEYIYAVFLQSFHMLIFYVLCIVPLGLVNASSTRKLVSQCYKK